MSENFESQGNCKTSLFSRRCRTGKNDTVYKCILYQLYQLLHDMFDMSVSCISINYILKRMILKYVSV